MKLRNLVICAALLFAACLNAQTTGSGGTLYAPTAIGQNIVISNVVLKNGVVADVVCPITSFGAGTYQWNWQCSGGTYTKAGFPVGHVSGSMALSCSGGGRAHPTVCWHQFIGNISDSLETGTMTVQAKGATNNAPGTVTAFSATW